MFQAYDYLVAIIACGIGIIGAGLGLTLTKTRSGRLKSVIGGAFAAMIGPISISFRAAILGTLLVAVVGLVISLVWLWRTEAAHRIRLVFLRPIVVGATLMVSGAVLIASGSLWFDYYEMDSSDEQLAHVLRIISWKPPLEPANIECVTDKGKPIQVFAATLRPHAEIAKDEEDVLIEYEWMKRVIPRSPATDESNCHGWVFTGGKYWVMGNDVPTILKDNGYRATHYPRPGDVVTYSKPTGNGAIEHTGIVRAVGTVTMVESKWGWMGVYLHAVDASCYGTNYTYYHANRTGHQFKVLNPSDAKPLARISFPPIPNRRPVENR